MCIHLALCYIYTVHSNAVLPYTSHVIAKGGRGGRDGLDRSLVYVSDVHVHAVREAKINMHVIPP